MRYWAAFLCGIVAALLLTLPGGLSAAAGPAKPHAAAVSVYLEGRHLRGAEAYMEGGAVYLPVRTLCEALGRRVLWDSLARRVYIW